MGVFGEIGLRMALLVDAATRRDASAFPTARMHGSAQGPAAADRSHQAKSRWQPPSMWKRE
jgi:hypothetical protein